MEYHDGQEHRFQVNSVYKYSENFDISYINMNQHKQAKLMSKNLIYTLASLWQCLQSNISPQQGALILHLLR